MFAVRSLSSRAVGAVRLVFREKHARAGRLYGAYLVRVDTWEAGANMGGAAHCERRFNFYGGNFDFLPVSWADYSRQARADYVRFFVGGAA